MFRGWRVRVSAKNYQLPLKLFPSHPRMSQARIPHLLFRQTAKIPPLLLPTLLRPVPVAPCSLRWTKPCPILPQENPTSQNPVCWMSSNLPPPRSGRSQRWNSCPSKNLPSPVGALRCPSFPPSHRLISSPSLARFARRCRSWALNTSRFPTRHHRNWIWIWHCMCFFPSSAMPRRHKS